MTPFYLGLLIGLALAVLCCLPVLRRARRDRQATLEALRTMSEQLDRFEGRDRRRGWRGTHIGGQGAERSVVVLDSIVHDRTGEELLVVRPETGTGRPYLIAPAQVTFTG